MAPAKAAVEEDELPKIVIQRYRDRLSVLRQAQEYSQKDDIARAVGAYMKYLESLAQYFSIEEKQLRPKFFEKDNNIAEILLISQVYWDLSKSYDRNPKLHHESERCLEQFVRFSVGFKFQFINSEMLRKFIKKKMAYNPVAFTNAYNKIKVTSKKCYIATHCYGEGHPNLMTLREFKNSLLKSYFGHIFIEYYYRFSPKFVSYLENNPPFGEKITKYFIRPLLNAFSIIVRKFIL